jgi:iron complex outermembrane receptor protein
VQANPVDRQSRRDPAASATVLRRDDLDQPGLSAATVLTKVPGAQLQRSGANNEGANVSLRGGTSAQLPVYLGPVLLNDELTGAADLSTVPLFFIERIEIYRGHAPDFVPRLGLGGAVVLEPRQPKRTRVQTTANVGSFGASSAGVAASSGNDEVGSALGIETASATNAYAYWDNRGTAFDSKDDRRVVRENADFRQNQWWNTGHYRPNPRTTVRWVLHALERKQGVTGLSLINPAHYARAQLRRELIAVTARLPCGSVANDQCQLELQSQLLRGTQQIDDPFDELRYAALRIDTRADRMAHRVQLTYRWSPRLATDWMAAAELGRFQRNLLDQSGASATRRSGLMGANARYHLTEALTALLLVRVWDEQTESSETLESHNQILPSGRLGAAYHLLDGLSLRANVGSYVRSPTLTELYGASETVRGNSSLREEAGFSEDLGLTWQYAGPRLRLYTEATAYHQHTRDLVAWQRTSFKQIRPYNVGQARQLGVDLSAGLAWNDWARIEAVVGLLDPRDVTPARTLVNSILPYRSRFASHLRVELSVPRSAAAQWARFAVAGISYAHRSSRYVSRAGDSVIDSSDAVDLDTRLGLKSLPLVLRGNLYNLFNRQNFDLLGLPLPGRAWYLGAEVALEFDS